MAKWADYLISEVRYNHENLIDIAIRHQDTDYGITIGKPVDRLTIASDIKNGLFYITIYSGKNSWKKGHPIKSFSISGNPYLRIDGNKVAFDYLGDIPEHLIVNSELPQELDLAPEPIVEPPSSPRGSLPKESAEELPQELDLAPEPIVEQTDEATPEQLLQLNDLQQQIDELENILATKLNTSDEPTFEQLSRVKELEKEIEKLEAIDIEHEIIQTLRKQNKKLDDIEHKLHTPRKHENISFESIAHDAYCVKCKTKRTIKNPEESIMKNGRPAIRGFCPVCNSKVFRIVKMKK